MRNIIFSLLMLTAVVISSCEKLPESEDIKLVIEGWIEAGEHPRIIVTENIGLYEDYDSIEGIEQEKMIRWAHVTLSDGDTTVTLAATYDDNYNPPFYYTSARMTGEIGKTYTLNVEYHGLTCSAVSTIPEKPNVDSIEITHVELGDTIIGNVWAYVTFPEGVGYYTPFVRDYGKKQFFVSAMGSLDSRKATNSKIKSQISNSKTGIDVGDNDWQFRTADTIDLKIISTGEAECDFWSDYKAQLLTRQLFFSTARDNIRTNVIGGKGVFYAFSSKSYTLYLREKQVKERN